MVEDFENLIGEKKGTLSLALEEMERSRVLFCAVASLRAAQWYGEQAASAVQSEHAVTEKLSDEQLRAMKQELAQVIATARNYVDEDLSSSTLWWHKQNPLPAIDTVQSAEDPWRYSLYGNRDSDTIDKALRFTFGRIASVLEKYGYLRSRDRDREGEFSWRERDRTVGRTGTRPYYPWMLEWSPEMRRVMNQYASKQKDALIMLKEIARLTNEKKQSEARGRWDSL